MNQLHLRHFDIKLLNRRANAYILKHPLAFVWQTLKGFKANQGLLLAGAVAYYALLSIVPFLMLVVVALSHVIDQDELLATLSRYLEWLVPSQSSAVVAELAHFLADRELVTWVLFLVMLFFSSLAFTALENAMSVIFHHRVKIKRRKFFISAVLPYCYIVGLGAGIMIITLVAGGLQPPSAAVSVTELPAQKATGPLAVRVGAGTVLITACTAVRLLSQLLALTALT